MHTQSSRALVVLAGVLMLGPAACGRGGSSAKSSVHRAALSYQTTVPASADTRTYVPGATTWGLNTSNGVDPDTGYSSDRTDFDLLDAGGNLLYRGVVVTPDDTVTVDQEHAERYLAWGVGKNGVNLDPTTDEAQHVFLSFSNDAATTTP